MHDPEAEARMEAQLTRALKEPLAVTRKRSAQAAVPRIGPAEERRVLALVVEGLEAAGIPEPRVRLELKPHANLRASLEQQVAGRIQRGERLTLTMSDAYVEAPDRVVKGLAASLGLRMFSKRRKVPELAGMLESFYTEWQNSNAAQDLQTRLRRARARKEGRGPRGDAYDLVDLTGRVTGRFLGGRLDRPVKVTWAARKGYSVLGHHDGDLDTIVISRALDHEDVPECVVAYVLYHELLHHIMGIQEGPSGNRRLHPPAFRRRERRFPNWQLMDAYLQRMCDKRAPVSRAAAPPAWHVLWDHRWDVLPTAPQTSTAADKTVTDPAAASRTKPSALGPPPREWPSRGRTTP